MHANQIQYFRVLHIIKSVVVVVVHAGHFKTCYAKVLTHSTLLPMILAGSGGVRGAGRLQGDGGGALSGTIGGELEASAP